MKRNRNNRPSVPAKSDLDPMTRPPLTRINFILMAISAAVIILGFLLMLGPSSTATEFNPDIFSTRRIVVGPTIAFLGFIFMGVAIIYRDKSNKATDN